MSRLLFRAAPTELGPSHPVVESINVSRLTALSWSILGFSTRPSRVYIFVNSRRIREFLPRLRPVQIELQNFFPLVNRLFRI